MDNENRPIAGNYTRGFPQDPHWLLAVEDVEEEAAILRRWGNAKAVPEDIALFAQEVAHPAFPRSQSCSFHHGRLDIE
jgi:hypothetical protein